MGETRGMGLKKVAGKQRKKGEGGNWVDIIDDLDFESNIWFRMSFACHMHYVLN